MFWSAGAKRGTDPPRGRRPHDGQAPGARLVGGAAMFFTPVFAHSNIYLDPPCKKCERAGRGPLDLDRLCTPCRLEHCPDSCTVSLQLPGAVCAQLVLPVY